MSGYGVLTANAFHLLDEENEDPQAILEASKVIAAKAEEKKKIASKEKPTAAPKPGSGAGQLKICVSCVPSSSLWQLLSLPLRLSSRPTWQAAAAAPSSPYLSVCMCL